MRAGPDEHGTWWRSSDDERFLRWLTDRSTADDRHLAPVLRVGRSVEHGLVAETLRPAGESLASALDRLGTPTTGVAVTLTVPLVALAHAAVSGAVLLGCAEVEDVLVDDAGAVVLCDHPDGAVALPDSTDSTDSTDGSGGADGSGGSGGSGAVRDDRPVRDDHPVRVPRHDGSAALLLAIRTVWDRVDPQDPARADVDEAITAARAGGPAEVAALERCIRSAAAPRPVRWDPAPFDAVFADPFEAPVRADPHGTGAVSAVGRLLVLACTAVEDGLPLGDRRVPARQLVVGGVVAVGIAAAGWFGLTPA